MVSCLINSGDIINFVGIPPSFFLELSLVSNVFIDIAENEK